MAPTADSTDVNGAPSATQELAPQPENPKRDWTYPKTNLNLVDKHVDDVRPLSVAVIGGGLAGVLAGILLPAKVPEIELTIYDKNSNFGGTWFENVYPGVRCDIPSHVYQSTFSPKTDWSDEFALGAEICEYWQSTARKYGVYKFAKFSHKVEGLLWSDAEGKWSVTVRNLATESVSIQKHDVVLSAIGRFNAWKLPSYPGIESYTGLLRHASNYDPSFDASGKTIAVIGNGASGIQLAANLAKVADRLDHYARSPTWITPSWAGDVRTLEPQPISRDQIRIWQADPEAYLAFRKTLEDKYWRQFPGFFKGSAENEELRRRYTQLYRERLTKKPELLPKLVPTFAPNCRRPTPGPGYLEAIQQDNVSYITDRIKRFTETGIETEDGTHRAVDAIFAATGANGDLVPPFPVEARGVSLADIWRRFDEPHAYPEGVNKGFPYTYMGAATPGFPNLLFAHGPHGTGASGTVPHAVEVQLTYYAKLLRKMSQQGIKSMEPSAAATEDFVEYCDALFGETVLADGCSSWYNGGRPRGRVHGMWPGSAAHGTAVRREPRWEDWVYRYVGEEEGGKRVNRFGWWFGRGSTRREGDVQADLTGYLKVEGRVDLRDVHESWWDLP